jgi:transcriptional regulator with XRE-family HTH domain
MDSRQQEAAKLLAQGKTQEQVARDIGVTRRTISRWLQVPQFSRLARPPVLEVRIDEESIATVQASVAEVAEEAIATMQASVTEVAEEEKISIANLWHTALKTVRDILEDPDSRNLDRLRAAELVTKWIELDGHFRRSREDAEKRSQPEQRGLSDETANEIRMKILGMPPRTDPSQN